MQQKKHYSIEDPPEFIIGASFGSASDLANALHEVNAANDPASWRMDGMMTELGQVVAYERPDGTMALTTWNGDTQSVWATFDVSPPPALLFMRKHMTSATSMDGARPAGAIHVICFYRPKVLDERQK